MDLKVSFCMQDYLAIVQNVTFNLGHFRESASKIEYYVN